jgi:tetratricopeptide (TPR) repeat protein
VAAHPEDPRLHLLQARVLRETFADQNLDRGKLEAQAAPIHAVLERAIAASEALLDAEPDCLPGYLYRGWAHLFRAQLHALSNQYWAAGRQAKRGKDDLDRVLRLDPQNPDAQGVLGTYLYFADILPGVVKVARTLVRVPGGDLERGLAALQYATRQNGYNRQDAAAILATIWFAFEGRWDDATRAFEALARDYPDNARLHEPLAVLDLYLPQRAARGLPRTARIAATHVASPEAGNRGLGLRLRFYQSVGELLYGRVAEARAGLLNVEAAAPRDPDWLLADVRLALADLALLTGDEPLARRMLERSSGHGKLTERLAHVLVAGAAASPEESSTFDRLQPAVRQLYAADPHPATAFAAAAGGDDPALHFWRGDEALLAGRGAEARAHFEQLTEKSLPARWRLFRALAFARLAEIAIAADDAPAAMRALDRGLDFYQDRDLLRHVMRARRRWLEQGRPGGSGSGAGDPIAPAGIGDSR